MFKIFSVMVETIYVEKGAVVMREGDVGVKEGIQ